MNPSSNQPHTDPNAPPALHISDFCNLRGPNGEIILVPRYMVPLVELRLEGIRQASELPLHVAKNGVGVVLLDFSSFASELTHESATPSPNI